MAGKRIVLVTGLALCIGWMTLAAVAAPGDLVWEFKTGNWVRTSPALTADGDIVFGSDDGYLYALRPDGTQRWRLQTTGAIWRGSAIADDGTIYVTSGGGTLHAVNDQGVELWQVDIGDVDYVSSKPAIGADGMIYVGSKDTNLYAVRPDGQISWTYDAGTAVICSPSVGPDGTIYVGSEDGFFHGVNPDGTQRFVQTIRWDMNVRSAAAIATDGTVYFGASDGYLYSVEADGTLRWELKLANNVLFSSPAIGPDGTIYAGSYDRKLHAVRPDGALAWEIELDGLVSSSPTVGADGLIYVGSEGGTVYAISSTGSVLWTFSAQREIYYSSPMLAADGTLYIGSFDERLYAIESSSPGLADTPWPTFGGNTRRTSRSGGAPAPSAQDGAPVAEPSVALSRWPLPYAGGYPAGIDIDAAGRVYVAVVGGMEILRLDPATDRYRSWGVGEGPEDVVVVGDLALCSVGQANQLVYFHPDSQAVSSVVLPSPDVGLMEIHRGPNAPSGDLVFWVAETTAQGVLRYTFDPADAPGVVGSQTNAPMPRQETSSSLAVLSTSYESFPYDVSLMPSPAPISPSQVRGAITEWRLDIEDYWVEDIAVAADGTVWISAGVPFLFRLDPAAGTLRMMETIRNAAIFQGLLPAADGSIWFGNLLEGGIGHFDPVLGVSETWRIPGAGEVYDLVFDAEGAIWYTDRVGDAIGRLDVRSGEATVFSLPADSEPLHLAVDAAGNIWFTAGSGNYIGRLDTSSP
jgi:outer membrane protein assembly factor BamB